MTDVHTAESLQDAFHYMFKDEVPALKRLVRMLPDNAVVINIGAGAGTSGMAILESRKDVFLYTIDIHREANPDGCIEAEINVFHTAGFLTDENLKQFQDGEQLDSFRYDFVISKSCDAGLGWHDGGGNPVDLVFIDGEHSYENCKADIEAWLPNIKPGGIIAVHDYRKQDMFTGDYNEHKPRRDMPYPMTWTGVDQAVDELLLDKYEQVMKVDTLIAFRVT